MGSKKGKNPGSQMKRGSCKIFSRMSSKITLLISAIVFVVILVLVIVAERRASSAMEETYLNYAQNLAE